MGEERSCLLFFHSQSTNVGFIYDTVMLYAKALHAMLLNDSNATVNNTERLMEYAIAMGKFEGIVFSLTCMPELGNQQILSLSGIYFFREPNNFQDLKGNIRTNLP